MTTTKWMRSWLRSRTGPATVHRPQLNIEPLEDRLAPSVSAVQNGGLLTVSMSGVSDAATIGGQNIAGHSVSVAGTGFGGAVFNNVTQIEVSNTSGVSGNQGVRFQDVNNGLARTILTGSLTVNGVGTVDFNNPSFPFQASSVTVSGGKFITQSNSVPQLATPGPVSLSTLGADSATGDAIGTATNPIRLAGVGSIAAESGAANGNQHFDFGGTSVTGSINAGSGKMNLTNGLLIGASSNAFGDSTTINVGTGGIIEITGSESIAGLTGSGIARGNGSLIVGHNNTSSTFGGILSGSNGMLTLTKVGTGTLTFNGSGTNTFNGSTWIREGTLALAGATADAAVSGTILLGDGTGAAGSAVLSVSSQFEIPDAASLIIDSDGVLNVAAIVEDLNTLSLDGGGITIASGGQFRVNGTLTSDGTAGSSVVGAGMFVLNSVTGTLDIADGPNVADLIVSAPLTGSDAIKAGAGTLTLNDSVTVNSFTVSAGTLLINGTMADGGAVIDLTVSPDAALGGHGAIQGATMVANGGFLLPGDEFNTGTLNTRNLTLSAGSNFGVKLSASTTFDSLNVTGLLSLNGATLFAIESPYAKGTFTIVNNDGNDAVVGTFDGLPEGSTFIGDNGTAYTISYVGDSGNDITLTSAPTPLVVTGPGNGTGRVLTANTSTGQFNLGGTISLLPGVTGEIRVAVADVNFDGTPDVVGGSGPGGSRVRVIDGSDGSVLADFNAFPGFGGGVYVAAGDLNGDGRAEVVVTGDGADAFTGPVANALQVRVFSGATLTGGTTNPPIHADFNGLASLNGAQGEGLNVRLGGRPAVADISGDGLPDLLVSAGNGGGPRVVIWPGQAFLSASSGPPPVNPIANLFVFESSQRGGAFITAGDLNGDGFADIAVGGGPGGGPRVRTVNSQILLGLPNIEAVNLDDPVNLSNGLVLNNFFAGSSESRGGVRVAMRDVDSDGLGDLVTGSGTNEQSQIRVYSDAAIAALFGSGGEPANPQIIDPFGLPLSGGVWIG